MSDTILKARYACFGNCESSGCSGHDLVVTHQHRSGAVTIAVDSKESITFDLGLLTALVNVELEYRETMERV